MMTIPPPLTSVFPHEQRPLFEAARQVHLFAGSLRTLDATSPPPLRSLRHGAWRVLALAANLGTAVTDRRRDAVIRQLRDRLGQLAAGLMALSDLGAIASDVAAFGRKLVGRVDRLLELYPGVPVGEETWEDERVAGPSEASEAAATASAATAAPATPAAGDGAASAPRPLASPPADEPTRQEGSARRSRRRRGKRR
jgi:hypothetical protein